MLLLTALIALSYKGDHAPQLFTQFSSPYQVVHQPTLTHTMKAALILSALLATALALPKNRVDLTCEICIDVMTDIDDFITNEATEEQIVAYFQELCHAMGSLLGSQDLEDQCITLFEENLPAIIEAFVNDNLNPTEVCVDIGACSPAAATTAAM